MFVGIRRRRRKQKRPQHLTELTEEGEEAKLVVAMSDSETDARRSTASQEPWENELRINEDDEADDRRIFTAQRMSDGEETVLREEGKEEEEEAWRQPCSPLRSKTTRSSISAQRIVDDLRRGKHSHSDGVDSFEAVSFQRDLSAIGDGFNLLRSYANFYDDRRTSPTGNNNITTAESYVIGKESHVTKLQSFVESLNDRSTERGSRFFDSPFAPGSFPLLPPRLKPVYWARHNNGCSSSLQPNSTYDLSSQPSCAKSRSSLDIAAEGPLDLSTKRFVSESGVGDSRQFEAQQMKSWGWGENFEKIDRSAQNLRFLPFMPANQSTKKVTHDLTESNSITSFLQSKDRWPNIRLDLKRHKEEINFHDSSTDVSSYLLKSQNPDQTNENGNRKRKQRGLPSSRCQSQENSAKRRKPSTTKDAVNVDGRNSLQMRSHRSSKCSGRHGKRGKDPDAGLGGEDSQAIEEPKRDKMADRLRTKCNCGMAFDSLYRLAVHIQKSGHVPENHQSDSSSGHVPENRQSDSSSGHVPENHHQSDSSSGHVPGNRQSDSSKPVCGREVWIPEEQRLQREAATLKKHSHRSTELNARVICTGQLVGTTGSYSTNQKHEVDFGGTLSTDEPELDLNRRNSVDRNLHLLFNLRRVLDATNGHREFEDESGFIETDTNSTIHDFQRRLKRKRDEEELIKNISKESLSDGNEMPSINDRLPLDDNEQLKTTSEQMINRPVVCRTDTFSAEADEGDHHPRRSIDRYLSDQIYQEQFTRSASVSPHSAAAIISSPENAAELPPPPPPLPRDASSAVCCLVAVGSDSPSADDHSKPVSRCSRSRESKERERRTTRSRDRPSSVSKRPKCERRRIGNETSSAEGGVLNEAAEEESSASPIAAERGVMNSDRRQSTGRRRRKRNDRKTNNEQKKSNASEKQISDLLLCKRRFPDVAPQQVLAAGNSTGDMTCSSESPEKSTKSDLPFVLPPSDQVDGSFSLWAMKRFVDNHFCAQNNARSATEGSTLPKNNCKITSNTSITCKEESTCSDSSRRLTTTKRLQESLPVKNLQVLSRKQNMSNRPCGNSFNSSDATSEEQKESKGGAKDIREQKTEDPVSGSDAINDSASDTDLPSTVLHSSRSQRRQFSDESSSTADGPRNGVTAVQSSETTTTTTGMENSRFPDGAERAERCADVTDTSPAVFTRKKNSSADERQLTGDYDKTRFPTSSEETNLTSSSSAFPGVDDDDEDEDDDSDRNSTAGDAVDRFLCSESQSLEQVC